VLDAAQSDNVLDFYLESTTNKVQTREVAQYFPSKSTLVHTWFDSNAVLQFARRRLVTFAILVMLLIPANFSKSRWAVINGFLQPSHESLHSIPRIHTINYDPPLVYVVVIVRD
jgi:hypothetical protein